MSCFYVIIIPIFYFLLGDREKIGWQQSAYKSSYVPFGPMLKPIKHRRVFEGPPTIQGDVKVHSNSLYATTTRDFYGNKYQEKVTVDDSVRVSAERFLFIY